MGRKYDKYVEKVKAENDAKLGLNVANGGSSKAGMQAAHDRLLDAHIDTEEAWDKVMEDPTG